MKHNLACKGTVTYTVLAINETEQARQCDNCGGFVVEPIPVATHPDNCRGLGLEHRWAPGHISGTNYCTKCGEPQDAAASVTALKVEFGYGPP